MGAPGIEPRTTASNLKAPNPYYKDLYNFKMDYFLAIYYKSVNILTNQRNGQ